MNSKLLNKDQIKIKQPLTTQKEVFQQIAAIAVDQGITSDPDEVIDGLLKREQEGTTGFQDGFAIPHVQVDAIKRPAIIIVSSSSGVEWNALDGKPASFFYLAISSQKGSRYYSSSSTCLYFENVDSQRKT